MYRQYKSKIVLGLYRDLYNLLVKEGVDVFQETLNLLALTLLSLGGHGALKTAYMV